MKNLVTLVFGLLVSLNTMAQTNSQLSAEVNLTRIEELKKRKVVLRELNERFHLNNEYQEMTDFSVRLRRGSTYRITFDGIIQTPYRECDNCGAVVQLFFENEIFAWQFEIINDTKPRNGAAQNMRFVEYFTPEKDGYLTLKAQGNSPLFFFGGSPSYKSTLIVEQLPKFYEVTNF